MMKQRRNLIIAIVLSATAGLFTLKNVSAPSEIEKTNTTNISVTDTAFVDFPIDMPSLTPTYEGCGYMWAYHDDPELSKKINGAVQALDSTASAHAQLFGEDCVYADGHSTFGVMETDFYFRIPVEDLTSEEALGNWMAKGLETITTLTEEEVQGKKGFADFTFTKSETAQIKLHVDIYDYLNNASDLKGAELFQKYYIPPPPPTTPSPITPTATP